MGGKKLRFDFSFVNFERLWLRFFILVFLFEVRVLRIFFNFMVICLNLFIFSEFIFYVFFIMIFWLIRKKF